MIYLSIFFRNFLIHVTGIEILANERAAETYFLCSLISFVFIFLPFAILRVIASLVLPHIWVKVLILALPLYSY